MKGTLKRSGPFKATTARFRPENAERKERFSKPSITVPDQGIDPKKIVELHGSNTLENLKGPKYFDPDDIDLDDIWTFEELSKLDKLEAIGLRDQLRDQTRQWLRKKQKDYIRENGIKKEEEITPPDDVETPPNE